MNTRVGIVDYGMGNIQSVHKQLNYCKAETIVIEQAEDFNKVDKIILPGVGHFGKAMENLHSGNLYDALNEAVLEKKMPILGICLGMQLMCSHSEEGDAKGLGWFEAKVKKFSFEDTLNYKVPHIGWNSVSFDANHPMMRNIPPNSLFYFVHSFHAIASERETLNTTIYNHPFSSALGKDHIFGVQYHPEKSHDLGQR